MTNWVLSDFGGRIEAAGANTSSSVGTALTSSTANTKGSWTQLIASTGYDYDAFMVHFGDCNLVSDTFFDIAVGGSGSEQILINNLHMSEGGTDGADYLSNVVIPIAIPSGTRIAARIQSQVAGNGNILIYGLRGGGYGHIRASRCVTYGAETADTSGISITSGGGVGTEGSWTEITSSTTADIYWLAVAINGQRKNWGNSPEISTDIAVGGSGSEQIIIDGLPGWAHATPDLLNERIWGPIPVHIPSGTRIAARGAAAAASQAWDVTLYGFS